MTWLGSGYPAVVKVAGRELVGLRVGGDVGFCTACGQPRRDEARFCTGCGIAFHDTQATESQADRSSDEGPPLEAPSADAPYGLPWYRSAPYSEASPSVPPQGMAPSGDKPAEDRPGTLRGADPYGGPPWADTSAVPAVEQTSQQSPAAADPFGDLYREPSAERDPRDNEETLSAPFARRSDDTSVLPQYLTPAAEITDAPRRERMGRRPPAGGGRKKTVVAVIVVIAVLAVAGISLAWETHRHNAPASVRPTQAGPSQPTQQGATQSSPRVSPSGNATLGNAAVAVAAGVAQNPDAPQVVNVLTSYFTAINAHDYQAYAQLLDQKLQQDLTPAKFHSGYRSTTDSGVMLTGISTTADGRVAATTTFTSHQHPEDSPDHNACTHWNITLFLEQQSGGYVISTAQPGYQASHQAC